MAELSQKEIDEFLGNMNSKEKNEEKEKIQVPEEEKVRGRIFSSPPKQSLRFDFEYRSPIIKKGNYIYNPPRDFKEKKENILKFNPNPKKVIVRSVEPYKLNKQYEIKSNAF